MISWDDIIKQIDAEVPSLSAAQRCHHAIIAAIKAHLLQPGARVVESELCRVLAVSRTPLREAVAMLRAQGVLEFDGNNLAVRKLGWSDIHDLYDMRILLEGAAAKGAAQRAGAAEKQVFAHLLAQEASYLATGADPATLAAHNGRFHSALLDAARNPFLTEALSRLSHLLVLLGDTAYLLDGRAHVIFDEHKAVITAIEAGDEVAAEQAMQHHLKQALAARLQLLAMRQDQVMD